LWGPKGNEDKLAIMDFIVGLGFYDLKSKCLVAVNNWPPDRWLSIRPDGGGFLTGKQEQHPKSIAFVDWQGKSHPITMKELDNDGLKKETILAELPTFFTPSSKPQIPQAGKWDRKTFIGRWYSLNQPRTWQYRVWIDTEKQVGVFGKDPRDSVASKQWVGIEYPFPKGGSTVRVSFLGDDDDNWHLEVIRPGEKRPEVILKETNKSISLIPSPNQELLAIRITNYEYDSIHKISKRGRDDLPLSHKILLLNRDGKVVKEIVETDNLPETVNHIENQSEDPKSKSLLIWGVAAGVGLLVLVAGGWMWWHRKRGKR
jgi:hypothetical protein